MRERELKALGEWNQILGDRETCNWLITVVTKADLWAHQRQRVLDYYREGIYFDELGEAKRLEPVVVEYCSVIHKFFGQARLSGVFDENDRIRARGNLLTVILQAINK